LGKVTPVYEQSNWKWFSDSNAEPVGGDALAAENVEPTLPDNTSKIRLRIRIDETAGGSSNTTSSMEHSTDGSTWYSLGPSNDFDYADGLGTQGADTTTYLLTGTNAHGEYQESASNNAPFGPSNATETDFCIVPTGTVSASTSYQFRYSIAGTLVPLASGKSYAVLTTAAAAANEEIEQARSQFRFVFSRVHGRVN